MNRNVNDFTVLSALENVVYLEMLIPTYQQMKLICNFKYISTIPRALIKGEMHAKIDMYVHDGDLYNRELP